MNYDELKSIAKQTKTRVKNLIALAENNDPFYSAGRPANKEKAQWFLDLWLKFGLVIGVHLRRVHYLLVSQEGTQKADGKPYENTENDWNYLCDAGKYARYLGLVKPGAFQDRRNPDPHIYVPIREYVDYPGWDVYWDDWELPSINVDLTDDLNWYLPEISLNNAYDYDEAMQPYHLEIWVEKSTMNDILKPICSQYGVNLVTGIGYMSITSVDSLLKRVQSTQKPCRIMYISDFDPAGDGMPTAVSRQIEYWINNYEDSIDIKLEPFILTKEQVTAYRLPRIPVKDSDLRKAKFEEVYGDGAVELDALEALYPGKLKELIVEKIQEFRDAELMQKIQDARDEAEDALNEEYDNTIKNYQDHLNDIQALTLKIVEQYESRLEELKNQMNLELLPVEEELLLLRQAIRNELEFFDVVLPDIPKPDIIPDSGCNWLYDSKRNYFEQLRYYQARKQGKG